MHYPTQTDLFNAVDATWAPFALHEHKGWLIREGAGGGQRVSAATLLTNTKDAEISSAVTKMQSLGQTPLFMIRNENATLDAQLDALGYSIVDPVVILAAPLDKLLSNPSKQTHTVSVLDAPSASAKKIWTAGGIDQVRLNIMARVMAPKNILKAGNMGVAFVATHNGIAMVHAVEVLASHRRKGVANTLMYKATQWAKDQNCAWMAVLTVRANIPAKTLYEHSGMIEAAAYHYRRKASD